MAPLDYSSTGTMAIGNKELFSKFCIGRLLIEISKEFPGVSIALKQQPAGSVYDLALSRAEKKDLCRICFAVKHCTNDYEHWTFTLNAQENQLIQAALDKGIEAFIFLVNYTEGVTCINRAAYEQVRGEGAKALFNVSKKVGQRSYRVHVPRTRNYINVPQNAFPNEVIKLIRKLIRKSQRSSSL